MTPISDIIDKQAYGSPEGRTVIANTLLESFNQVVNRSFVKLAAIRNEAPPRFSQI